MGLAALLCKICFLSSESRTGSYVLSKSGSASGILTSSGSRISRKTERLKVEDTSLDWFFGSVGAYTNE